MESRIEQALEKHRNGYNCAQSVICTYCDLFGMDEETAYRMSEGFGRGLGGAQGGVCGAVSGMCMIAGLRDSKGGAEKGKTKKLTYQDVRGLCAKFQEMNGSIICSDLLGLGAPGIKRSCDGCIEDACRLLEAYLDEDGKGA